MEIFQNTFSLFKKPISKSKHQYKRSLIWYSILKGIIIDLALKCFPKFYFLVDDFAFSFLA